LPQRHPVFSCSGKPIFPRILPAEQAVSRLPHPILPKKSPLRDFFLSSFSSRRLGHFFWKQVQILTNPPSWIAGALRPVLR
jgi:hypothetical protein